MYESRELASRQLGGQTTFATMGALATKKESQRGSSSFQTDGLLAEETSRTWYRPVSHRYNTFLSTRTDTSYNTLLRSLPLRGLHASGIHRGNLLKVGVKRLFIPHNPPFASAGLYGTPTYEGRDSWPRSSCLRHYSQQVGFSCLRDEKGPCCCPADDWRAVTIRRTGLPVMAS